MGFGTPQYVEGTELNQLLFVLGNAETLSTHLTPRAYNLRTSKE